MNRMIGLVPLVVLAACGAKKPLDTLVDEAGPGSGEVTFLLLNDTYRLGTDAAGRGGFARLRTLRESLPGDVVVLHAGDLFGPSLLSTRYRGEQIVDVMNHLDGDGDAFDGHMFATFGNHEFDKGEPKHLPGFNSRLQESGFTWLHSNIDFAADVVGDHRATEAIVEVGGVKVGLLSVTLDSTGAAFVEGFDDPVETARERSAWLRSHGAHLVVALTHQRLQGDIELLTALGPEGPDVVFGGHEHEAITQQVGDRWIFKGDADLTSLPVVTVSVDGARKEVSHRLVDMQAEGIAPDAVVDGLVHAWVQRFKQEHCADEGKPDDCLDAAIGRTAVDLEASELVIRKHETNLGDFLTDRMLEAFAGHGAQVALLNSGSVRLNDRMPAGTDITEQHLLAMLPFSSGMRLLEVPGSTLLAALDHSVSDWTGSGHWLQVAGIAFTHIPDAPRERRVGRPTLLATGTPIEPEAIYRVVVPEFLTFVEGGQDGYTMFSPEQEVPGSREEFELKDLVIKALLDAGSEGIAPALEGRICQTGTPCLLRVD